MFQTYTTEQLEVQYNKRVEVPDHEEYFERWRSDSEAVRQRHAARLDVRYGAGERETLDVFPARGGAAPVAVFIHGGYWQALNKSYFSFIAPSLLERGFTVVVLNYPLCPAVRLRDIVQSLRWAMIFLYRNVEHYNGAREELHLLGHSAGGHLTAMLQATKWSALDSSLNAPLVSSGISISGVFELEPLQYTSVNQALQLEQAEIRELSPMRLAPPVAGEIDLLVGESESDEFKRQSKQLEQVWSGDQFAARYQVLSGHNHFSILEELARPEGVIVQRLGQRIAAPA